MTHGDVARLLTQPVWECFQERRGGWKRSKDAALISEAWSRVTGTLALDLAKCLQAEKAGRYVVADVDPVGHFGSRDNN